ncbi:MAG: TonB-dependent receptor [Deltaproteobacteria bacterium]|nr:TonB-dependent receptor [Deltaproteobacteria bacterium]
MNTKAWLWVVVLVGGGGVSFACSVFAGEVSDNQTVEEAQNSMETIIRDKPMTGDKSKNQARVGEDDLAGAAPEEALEVLADVDLVRSGGPLSPTRLMVRGLSGPRTRVLVDGLALDNPSSGSIDVANVLGPLAPRVQTEFDLLGGSRSLELTFDDVILPSITATLGVGTLDTRIFQMVLRVPFAELDEDGGHLSVAVRGAETQGDFLFQLAENQPQLSRTNNEQHRLQTWTRLKTPTQFLLGASVTSEHFLLAHIHEGGVAGFAAAPLTDLRAASSGMAGRSLARFQWAETSVKTSVSSRLMTQGSWRNSGPKEKVSSLRSTAHLDIQWQTSLPLNFELQLNALNELERDEIQGLGVERGAARAAASIRLQHRFVKLEANAGLQILSDLIARHGWGRGPLPAASVVVEGGPKIFIVGVRAALQNRAPSLQEMFAPAGLVVPNPTLLPETGVSVDGYASFRLSRTLKGKFVLFASRMEEAIIVAHQNAFELSALNTGPLSRAGFEASLQIRPTSWLKVESVSAGLLSEVDATGAPLPSATPFSHRLSATLGQAHRAHFRVSLRHRSRTPANLFGTLFTPSYSLVDVQAAFPVTDAAMVRISASNILNELQAKDAYLFPLPGRQIFLSVEVKIQ